MKRRKGDKRRYPRLTVPVRFRPAGIFGPRGRIFNIGLGGVMVYSDMYFKKGKRLKMEMFLPKDRCLEATARVVWIKKLPPDYHSFYDIGLEFISLPSDAIHELRHALENVSSSD